jgi:spermidine synthase
VLFVLSGVASLLILALIDYVLKFDIARSVPLLVRIVAYTSAIFFLPTFILGTISPIVIKLSLVDLARTGSIVGRIYAVSTVGSIVGTFVTGFYLIEAMGTRTIVWTVAIVLIVLGLVIGQFWRSPVRQAAVVLVVAILGIFYSYRETFAAPCVHESSYFCIRISEATLEGRSVKSLVLDHLVHSYVDLDDPKFIGYGYERVYSELTEWHVRNKLEFNTLSIGGGGFTFPKYVTAVYPGAHADVLEIDPAVTQAAHDYLNLPHDPRIAVHNQDARLWFIENQPVDRYDLVFGDAFNDLSVPWHITTLEFDQRVRQSMRNDGILMTNIIDNYRTGDFLRSYLRTLTQSFEHVYLFGLGAAWTGSGASTYVAVASPSPLDLESFREFEGVTTKREKFSAVMDAQTLREYLDSGRQITLTDDYAPVDNLVARLFVERGY